MNKLENSSMNEPSLNTPIDQAIAAPYRMEYRTISSSRFEGTWPRPVYGAVNENLLDDDDDSFFEIAKEYLEKCSR